MILTLRVWKQKLEFTYGRRPICDTKIAKTFHLFTKFQQLVKIDIVHKNKLSMENLFREEV